MKNKLNLFIFVLILILFAKLKQCYPAINDEHSVCQTASCKTTGASMRSCMNTKVDPCDDFYEFSCGEWKNLNPIPKDKSKYGRMNEMEEKLQIIMKSEMNKTSVPSDAMSVRYAMDFYKACTHEDVLESRGYYPLIETLNLLGGWPLLGQKSMYNETSYNWSAAFVYTYAVLGQPAIFEMSVNPDANQTNMNGVPEFGIGRNQLVNRTANKEIVEAYKKYIHQSALLLGAENNIHTQQDVEEVLSFESELAKVSTKAEDMRGSDVWYNKITFNELNNLTEHQLNWLKLSQNVLQLYSNNVLKANDYVIVSDISYYKGASLLVNKTPKRVIANYLGWNAVQKLGIFTTKRFREIEHGFKKVTSGVFVSTPLWRHCIDSLESYLSLAYSRKYIDNHFESTAKDEAKTIVKHLRKSMKTTLKNNKWLDQITKNRSIEKLNAVTEYIGYPEWILNNYELDNYYNLTKTVDKHKAFESLLYLKTKSLSNMFGMHNKEVNKTLSWPTFPAKVNAFYDWTQNAIALPAGILSEPFFRSGAPAHINFGAIGHVIGHEFTHGFDDQGSEFDKNGNLINWWTDCMKKLFKEKTKCFIDRFSGIIVPELNITLNGRNTVGEDMSDAGGIRLAYKAYKNYEKSMGTPQRLPYVNGYTPEQQFFIAFANIGCANYRLEALKNQIEYNPHTPNKYRVNLQLTKYEKFNKAFNCEPGRKMNSGFTCDLW